MRPSMRGSFFTGGISAPDLLKKILSCDQDAGIDPRVHKIVKRIVDSNFMPQS
jgi:hypothetical protein